jgi:8-amino-7-oxononanoate synthase
MRASEQLMSRLRQDMQQREAMSLMRHRLLRDGRCGPVQLFEHGNLISFCSNDYLGLAGHPAVITALQAGASRYGVGSGASHLVTGHCHAHHALEEELAAFTGREKALLFSTGYMANVGIINALVSPGDHVFHDALNHASLLDGGWLSRGISIRFAHDDLGALESQLCSAKGMGNSLIVSDGVFSMDGDVARLSELVKLADRHGAALMIDDAHGFGCLGARGAGVIELFPQLADSRGLVSSASLPILVGTLGKALGTAGAFVVGDADLIDYLQQFARTYIYTTAMPPALAEATRASLRLVTQEPWRRERLQTLIQRFRRAVVGLGLPLIDSNTPIQAIVLGDAQAALAASALMRRRGIQVSAIRAPTVQQGQARLRITLSAAHSDAHVEQLLQALAEMAACYDKNRLTEAV